MFSAPNYCDSHGNKGAILKYTGKCMNIKQFTEKPHPFWLSDFQDVFNWSYPYVGNTVTDIICSLLQKTDDEEDMEEEDKVLLSKVRWATIKNKVMAVGTMVNHLQVLRDEADTVDKLKELMGGSLPTGMLSQGRSSLQSLMKTCLKHQKRLTWEEARLADQDNERVPPLEKQMPKT